MLGASRTITRRLLAPAASTLKSSVRHKTVPIFTITAPIQPTLRTMGPYPRTPEEMEKAARKYNMIPEDYKPFPESDGFGDYPDLPAIGAFNRDKYEDYEDVWEHRHHGEPLNMHADTYRWEGKDPMWDEKLSYIKSPYWFKYTMIFGAVFFFIFWHGISSHYGLYFNMPYKMRKYHDGPYYAFPEVEGAHDSHHHH